MNIFCEPEQSRQMPTKVTWYHHRDERSRMLHKVSGFVDNVNEKVFQRSTLCDKILRDYRMTKTAVTTSIKSCGNSESSNINYSKASPSLSFFVFLLRENITEGKKTVKTSLNNKIMIGKEWRRENEHLCELKTNLSRVEKDLGWQKHNSPLRLERFWCLSFPLRLRIGLRVEWAFARL